MEEKGLHIEKPERGDKHYKHSHRQEGRGTLIPKGSKSRKCKHGKVSDRTDGCDRKAGNFRVNAAEHSETIRRTTADRCFASKILHSEVGGVRQAGERNQGSKRVNNNSPSTQHDRG